jgi:hypothetical protein
MSGFTTQRQADFEAGKAGDLQTKANDALFDAMLGRYGPLPADPTDQDDLDEAAEAALRKAARKHIRAGKLFNDLDEYAASAKQYEAAANDFLDAGWINDVAGEKDEARPLLQEAIDWFRAAAVDAGSRKGGAASERALQKKARDVMDRYGPTYPGLHNP